MTDYEWDDDNGSTVVNELADSRGGESIMHADAAMDTSSGFSVLALRLSLELTRSYILERER